MNKLRNLFRKHFSTSVVATVLVIISWLLMFSQTVSADEITFERKEVKPDEPFVLSVAKGFAAHQR